MKRPRLDLRKSAPNTSPVFECRRFKCRIWLAGAYNTLSVTTQRKKNNTYIIDTTMDTISDTTLEIYKFTIAEPNNTNNGRDNTNNGQYHEYDPKELNIHTATPTLVLQNQITQPKSFKDSNSISLNHHQC